MAKVEWTEDFEQKLKKKLEDEYQQADNMVVWASRCSNPLKRGAIIKVESSAESMIHWIKNELGICER